MISKPNDYEQTTSFGASDYKSLPKGGYVCRILKAEEMNDKNGNPMIHIAFDIIDGEYTGYFMNLYQSRKKSNTDPMKEVKYPFGGQMWIAVNDYEDPKKTNRKFKGFCTALEESGTQVWNGNQFMLQNLKDAQIGIVFQNVEKEYEGKTRWETVPWGCRSVEAIDSGDYFIPDDKPLPPQQNNGFSSQSNGFSSASSGSNANLDSFAQAEQDLPF